MNTTTTSKPAAPVFAKVGDFILTRPSDAFRGGFQEKGYAIVHVPTGLSPSFVGGPSSLSEGKKVLAALAHPDVVAALAACLSASREEYADAMAALTAAWKRIGPAPKIVKNWRNGY